MADCLRSLKRQIVVRARKKVAHNIASVLSSVSSSSASETGPAGFASKRTHSASMLLLQHEGSKGSDQRRIVIIHLQPYQFKRNHLNRS
jgi:hypothetical protein